MLTILREAEEWTRGHLREVCLLLIRECNYEKLALRKSKRQSACTSSNFTFARPLMGIVFLVYICCRYVVCCMSVVCQINYVGGITFGPRACSKSFFGG